MWSLEHKKCALVATGYPQAFREVGDVYPSLHLMIDGFGGCEKTAQKKEGEDEKHAQVKAGGEGREGGR